MLSADMRGAAEADGLGDAFVYAVAGSGTDGDCGTCYQVQLLDAERQWKPTFKLVVVQVVNSGFDVMPGQLDLFMGAGGFGYFTACNADCASRHCQGGPCAQGMYDGTFDDWTHAEFMDPNACYSGGIKWLNDSATVKAMCGGLGGGSQAYKDAVVIDSCVRTNEELYHQNFVSTDYVRVRCPEHLYRLTGMRRADDAEHPYPAAGLALAQACRGSREQGHYCVTRTTRAWIDAIATACRCDFFFR
jgi:hypothetical protein